MIIEKRGYIKEYDENGKLIRKYLKTDEPQEVLDLYEMDNEVVESGDE